MRKKNVLILLLAGALLFLISPQAISAYKASGKLYTSSGGVKTEAKGATGTLSTNNSSSTTPMTTSTANNDWYAGWSAGDLSGKTMRGSAALGQFMGSKSWTASSSGEDKGQDITLYSTVAINPGLGIDMEAMAITNPGPQIFSSVAIQNNTGAPITVNGFTAEVIFDPEKVLFNGAAMPPESFFDVFPVPPTPIVEPNKVIIQGAIQTPPKVIAPEQSIELFIPEFEVLPFVSRDSTSMKITVHLDAIGLLESDAVPHETVFILGTMEQQDPYLALNTEADWTIDVNILPMPDVDFQGYIMQWQEPNYIQFPELPYPPGPYIIPELYVFEGDPSDPCEPNEPGLVMKWGDETTTDGNYTAAWKYSYRYDPDYTNCIIQVTVIAPQFGAAPPHNQVNIVSLGLQNIPAATGAARSWYWNCGPGTSIPWNTPVTITIDTSKTGVTAASPVATNFLNNPGFNLTAVQYLIFDENANIAANPSAPPPGQALQHAWNYWQNLTVTPKAGGNSVDSKWYVKYSQPPVLWDPNADNLPPLIKGWDELSDYNDPQHQNPIMADDWKCEDDRPVTDIHWWGSFIGWNKPYLPPVVPQKFHIGIWTDVPAGVDLPYSHPGMLIWENYCDTYIWNYAGIDHDPRDEAVPDEACFQFAQFLSEDEWFYQEPMIQEDGQVVPNVYWLSIAPIWTAAQRQDPNFHPWGWKSRPKFFNDDACSILSVKRSDGWPNQPLNIFDVWASGNELLAWIDGVEESWDLAFELTTNEPGPEEPVSADLDDSGFVDFKDFAIFADQWLTTGP